jgi:hypothetical protein
LVHFKLVQFAKRKDRHNLCLAELDNDGGVCGHGNVQEMYIDRKSLNVKGSLTIKCKGQGEVRTGR